MRRYVRHVVTEDQRVERVVALLDAGDVRAIGPVLTAGHASLRDDLRISCPELDLVVDTATGRRRARRADDRAAASAARRSCWWRPATRTTSAKAVTEAFAAAGFTAPRIFPAVPSAGARRIG